MTIWMDMDGTIADLYGVENWLAFLQAENVYPYLAAKPLCNFSRLAKLLHKVQNAGWELGIISWTSKGGSELYNGEVALAKMTWLHKHLPSITWDNIKIVPYGTNKWHACGGGILFDDEEQNRNTWGTAAYTPDMIFTVLKKLVEG